MDANGNSLSANWATLRYDEANRVASAAPTSGGTAYYGYAPDSKRIYEDLPTSGGQERWTFYGAMGEKLGVFDWVDFSGTGDCSSRYLWPITSNVWFGGKLIFETEEPEAYTYYGLGYAAGATYQDRVGTNRSFGARFYQYGAEITNTINDHEKFGTYQRDSFTGLDYADQRYYASAYGRFNTPDPYQALANGANDPSTPQSWNKYAYVQGDPVNRTDRHGLYLDVDTGGFDDWDTCVDDDVCYTDGESGDGGGGGGSTAPPPCDPGYLPANSLFAANGIQSGAASILTGADIDYAADAIFAESNGSAAGDDAVGSVIFNRLANPLFGNLPTLTQVLNVKCAFAAVAPCTVNGRQVGGPTSKFTETQDGAWQNFDAAECAQLADAILAMVGTVMDGSLYTFTSFRKAGSTRHSGTVIGGNIFWTDPGPTAPIKQHKPLPMY